MKTAAAVALYDGFVYNSVDSELPVSRDGFPVFLRRNPECSTVTGESVWLILLFKRCPPGS